MKILIICLLVSLSAYAKKAIVYKKTTNAKSIGQVDMILGEGEGERFTNHAMSFGEALKIDIPNSLKNLKSYEMEGYLDGSTWKLRERSLSASDQKKKDRKIKIELGRVKKSKCEDALNFMNGFTNSMSEADVDALEIGFEAIYKALKGNRLNKSRRLIRAVSDANYLTLRDELLEILE